MMCGHFKVIAHVRAKNWGVREIFPFVAGSNPALGTTNRSAALLFQKFVDVMKILG